MWNLVTGELVRLLEGHPCGVNAVAVSVDGEYVVSAPNPGLYAFEDTSPRLWSLSTGEMLRAFERHRFTVSAVAVTPDQRLVISGGGSCFQRYDPDSTIKLSGLATGELARTFVRHDGPVVSLCVTPDSRSLASAGGGCVSRISDGVTPPREERYRTDGSIRFWDLGTEELTASFQADDAATCMIIANAETLVCGSRNGAVHILRFEA